MRSGELAALAGVTVRTLRHYHQIGLLPEPERGGNGYRDYDVHDLLATGFHQLLEHRVEVEISQRAVQVVRATNRTTGLHTGEPLHRLTGERPHHRLVAVHQRLHQQVGHLLGRQ